MTENVRKTTLDNGVRVVTESLTHVASVAVGLWMAAGSRDETPEQAGLAHFLEHMLFKGTERRPSSKILTDELENVGGYLNAFTDRELTCYHARALAEDLPLTIDLLTDMFRNSLFDPEETKRERKVVLEELKRRDDDAEDLIHDLFAEKLFPGHALGLPVIGSVETVSSFGPDDLRAFVARHGGPQNLVLSATGNLEHEKVVELAQKALGDMKPTGPREKLSTPVPQPGKHLHSRPDEQANFVVGVRGYTHFDDDRYAAAMLDVALGGSMGSRLFMEIREKRGLAYSVGSYSQLYREGGYFAAYGGTSPESLDECLELVYTELEKVRAGGILPEELHRAQVQFRSALIMGQESMNSRMNRLGKAEIVYDRVASLSEIREKIDAVTLDDVFRVAQNLIPDSPDGLTTVAVGPFDEEHQSEEETE